MGSRALLNLSFLLLLATGGYSDVIFNYENQCAFPVWLAASPSTGDVHPEREPESIEKFKMPDPWTGSIWARTTCGNNASSLFSCETGDCGTGKIDCQSPPPKYPVTLLNFGISNSVVTYEVSLNHGHNVAVRIQPVGGTLVGRSGPCPIVDCTQPISDLCPSDMVAKNANGIYIGCYSACDAFKDPKFCCTGAYSSKQKCKPNEYSETFKDYCKLAHTYPGDNNPPIYKCSGATSYNITFCPRYNL